MIRRTKGRSDALNWLRSRVLHEGDDCLTWPFAKDRGYGQVKSDGKIRKAHRLMCEWTHGEPPTPRHEAAHSCGNGAKGCVNPKHLLWKTRDANHADAFAHGTAHTNTVGMPRAKLTSQSADEIRSLKGVLSQDKIAERYGVSHSTVAKIHRGEAWVAHKMYGAPRFTTEERAQMAQRIRRSHSFGNSYEQISRELGISRAYASGLARGKYPDAPLV